jgi:hypothetical protein
MGSGRATDTAHAAERHADTGVRMYKQTLA